MGDPNPKKVLDFLCNMMKTWRPTSFNILKYYGEKFNKHLQKNKPRKKRSFGQNICHRYVIATTSGKHIGVGYVNPNTSVVWTRTLPRKKLVQLPLGNYLMSQ